MFVTTFMKARTLAVLLLSVAATATAKQCHLKLSNAVVNNNPASPSQTSVTGTDTNANGSDGATTTATTSPTATATLAPFDYENDKIRGVNL